MKKIQVLFAGVLICAAVTAVAQQQQQQVIIQGGGPGQTASPATPNANLTFEVASVKPNKSGENFIRFQNQPGGRFNINNAPLREIIRFAYQLQNFQIVGAPDWIASDRFDVVAKAEGDIPPTPPGSVGPMQIMVRNLLAERF